MLPFFTSHPVFRNEEYRNLIGKVTNGDKLTNHIAPISMNEIRVVDESLAYLLGEKILGSQPALGSQAQLGEFFIQKVNGKLYWIAPLEHSGFFKWLNNKKGTTGYVMVSATNERDVKLVQEVNGKPTFLISLKPDKIEQFPIAANSVKIENKPKETFINITRPEEVVDIHIHQIVFVKFFLQIDLHHL